MTVGPFESDALLVPQHCHFYHEHNQCDTYKKWGDWATTDCLAKEMRIDSFSMLLDCDIDRFAGVEYVCCPKGKSKSSINSGSLLSILQHRWCSTVIIVSAIINVFPCTQ